ncbi:MAG: Rpn family recombination-promoting nuclease/putative transposase [Chitinispirillia bacterium]|nr:Rpn family recombination-promoting nuclease/putative transposase [Chitinispirillia bacterium]MCL2241097.1 Rpn family recombination-promoting nuclease/putative transposase [Chitinispirillia bacterium]
MAKLPTDADILPPSDDHIFKTLLTRPDAKRVLMDVISAAIERPVVDVFVRNTELPISDTAEKGERLDVNCTIDGGDQVDVEMQSSRMEESDEDHDHKNFKNKYVYYGTDLHSSQPSKGKKYVNLVRTYQITFCSYTVLPDRPNFVNRAALRFEDGMLFSNQLNMVIVEMNKLNDILKRPNAALTSLEMWSAFFQFADKPEYRDIINHIIETKEEVGMAATLLQEISKDEQERARFRSRRMFETDMASNILTAEDNVRVGIAKKMKADGADVDTIAKWTGLTVDEILKLNI